MNDFSFPVDVNDEINEEECAVRTFLIEGVYLG